jgi:hypothetical protein
VKGLRIRLEMWGSNRSLGVENGGWTVVLVGGLWFSWMDCGSRGWTVVLVDGLWFSWMDCGSRGWTVVLVGGL